VVGAGLALGGAFAVVGAGLALGGAFAVVGAGLALGAAFADGPGGAAGGASTGGGGDVAPTASGASAPRAVPPDNNTGASVIDVNKSTSDGKMAGRPPRFRMSAQSSGNGRSREEAAPDSRRAPVKFDLASPEGREAPAARASAPSLRPPSRRTLLAAAAGLVTAAATRPARAIGDRSTFELGRLALPGLPDPRPSALRRLAWEVVRRTSIVTSSEAPELRPADAALFRHPFLVLAGDRAFNMPSEPDLGRLRRYLTYGGFLLIDSAEGRAGGGFDDSVRKMLAQLLPGELPARIPDGHVLWKSFYVLGGAPGRVQAAPYVEGVERDRRLAVVYSQNDLEGAWARDGFGHWEHEVIPGGDSQREDAFRFGVNLVMYALCLDYKTEQAHIDYILRTRRFPR
jgi:hypothetical protein